ncbi:CTLH/CRA C-terminal to lish motif domain-domain-containing protein [Kockovaella imperatae]|uniref:CTLH/CRA C-terminal to lish motif domain-domain-containing protein n=1 Tax=Kockovaella imperatae TaxID=4999 RepID=A0A1Y1UD49_9TREE|nr:CTLH/CRA C-terminal to lish motif domain-domain-containing protein [Kockovaella imperatae]ORX35454.1 CTLH/CRA C-terminal to lish motif domain-domain-containing protein [Kockovaella imperatae]
MSQTQRLGMASAAGGIGRISSARQEPADPRVEASKWEEELNRAVVSKSDLNALLFDYLVVEGFSDAAVEFARETGLPHDVDHAMIRERMEIREAVQDGRVEEAVRRVNELDPEILDTNAPLLFHLHLLRLIELIRHEEIEQALNFARDELAPRGAQNPEFLADLEKTMGLLTFPEIVRFADDAPPSSSRPTLPRPPLDVDALDRLSDPAFQPIMALMKKSQRDKVAQELNAAILESQGQGMETKLGGLVRLMSWGEERLEKAGIGLPFEDRMKGRAWADAVLSRQS